MAEEKYIIPANPEYSEEIRKLQDSDPASASTVFNPLFQRLIENIAAVWRMLVRLSSNLGRVAEELATTQRDLIIPPEGWAQTGTGRYPYSLDIQIEGVTAQMIPNLTILEEGEPAAIACGLAPRVQTVDGTVRVFAASPPTEPIPASLTLQGDASGIVIGGGESPALTPGAGLILDRDGNLALDAATKEEAQAIFKGSNG